MGLPSAIAVLSPLLQDRALAVTASLVGLMIGGYVVFRSLTEVQLNMVYNAGLIAWWGGTCILAGVLGFAARLATWHGDQPALRLRVAAGLAVTAFAFFAGQIFEPLGGLLAAH